jgi:hypothetical protein
MNPCKAGTPVADVKLTDYCHTNVQTASCGPSCSSNEYEVLECDNTGDCVKTADNDCGKYKCTDSGCPLFCTSDSQCYLSSCIGNMCL